MKKIIALFLCCLFLLPCLAFAKRQKQDIDDNIYSEDSELNDERSERKKEREARKEAKQQEKEQRQYEKDLKRKGWSASDEFSDDGPSQKMRILKNGQDISVVKNIIKMQTSSKNGSVAFYITGKKGGWFPVIETNDLVDSSYVSLFIDNVEYRLNRSKKVDYFFEFDDNSIVVVYNVERIARVKAVYKIEGDSILVTYSIENLDSKQHAFGVKAVYNTILGENQNYHFTTSDNAYISSEYIMIPSQKNSFVVTNDEKRLVKFVVFGEGITPPKMVVLANKDIIENSSLSTNFKNGRAFNSLLSYNNSSVGLFWSPKLISEQESVVYSYKLNFAILDTNAAASEDVVNYDEPLVLQEVVQPEPVEETPPPAKVQEEEPQNEIPYYDFTTERNYIDTTNVNEAYIRRLIDEINTLERSDSETNRRKIRELQNEIDEVLRILRSRR